MMRNMAITMAAVLLTGATTAVGGLIGNWSFDDGSGETAADAVNGNNATLTNTPTWTTGKIGGGLEFDKDQNEYGVISNISQVPTGDNAGLTMSLWVKPTEAPVNNWGDDSGIWLLRTGSDGLVGFSVVRDTNPYEDVDDVQFRGMTRPIDQAARSSGNILENGTWVHLVGVYEGTDDTTNEDYLTLYADGVQVASNTDETHKTLSNSLDWHFGRDEHNGSSRDIDAVLDDAAMWDEALTAGKAGACSTSRMNP